MQKQYPTEACTVATYSIRSSMITEFGPGSIRWPWNWRHCSFDYLRLKTHETICFRLFGHIV